MTHSHTSDLLSLIDQRPVRAVPTALRPGRCLPSAFAGSDEVSPTAAKPPSDSLPQRHACSVSVPWRLPSPQRTRLPTGDAMVSAGPRKHEPCPGDLPRVEENSSRGQTPRDGRERGGASRTASRVGGPCQTFSLRSPVKPDGRASVWQVRGRWTFLNSHGHVLMLLSRPQVLGSENRCSSLHGKVDP